MSSVQQFPPSHLIPDEDEEKQQQQKEQQEVDDSKHTPLGLPAPGDATAADHQQTLKFNELGPIVINSDGTLSRIHNWQTMTENEKSRTVRVLVKRNQIRMESLSAEADQQEQEKAKEKA